MSIARAAVRSGGESDRDAMLDAGKRAPAGALKPEWIIRAITSPRMSNVSKNAGNPWTRSNSYLVAFVAPRSVTLGSLKDDHTR